MEKTSIYILMASIMLLLSCSKKVTDRYLITYSPPTEHLKPEVEVKQIYYDSDSVAVATETENVSKLRENLNEIQLNEIEKYFGDKNEKDYIAQSEFKVRMAALEGCMNQQYILVFITHDASVDSKDVFEFLKETGFNIKKLKEYGEEHNFDLKVVEI